jgi:HD-like signal output (HDOD) protein
LEKEIKSLPPLPASIVRIQQLCMEKEVNISALTRVIESDPMLSANILKSVNSPLYGMSKGIGSIRQAVMLFGVAMIRGFAAANAIKKAIPIDLQPYGITIDILTETSECQMLLLTEWITRVDKQLLPLLTSGVFLMELGKLIASRKLVMIGNQESFLAELLLGKSIIEVEKSFLGMNSYEIAAMMFAHWNFDPELIEMLSNVNAKSATLEGKILYVIQEAINIRESLSEESATKALSALKSFGLEPEPFNQAIIVLKSTMERMKK